MTKIDYLLFDLDDTLYANSANLFTEVGERIEAWCARTLGISLAEARALRTHYFAHYGTTMAGLLRDHPWVDIHDYLDDVHQVDVSKYLTPDPALVAMLSELPARKVIFTNAINDWAERVLAQLGVRAHFDAIVDVRAVDLLGKPKPEAYERILALLETSGDACVLIDDQPRNCEVGASFGMTTILVREGSRASDGAHYAVNHILETAPILTRLVSGD